MNPNKNLYSVTEFVVNGLRVKDLREVSNYIDENRLTEVNSFVELNGVRTEVITPAVSVTQSDYILSEDDFNEDGTVKSGTITDINNNQPNTFIKA